MIEKSIGQMLAKPRPRGDDARHRQGLEPVISARRPTKPKKRRKPEAGARAHDRQHRAAQKPADGQQAERSSAGPNLLAVFSSMPMPFIGGIEETAHAGFRAHVEENAQHRQQEDGFAQQAPAEPPMLGGTSALVSSTFSKATATKASAISTQNSGKAAAPAHALEERQWTVMAVTR